MGIIIPLAFGGIVLYAGYRVVDGLGDLTFGGSGLIAGMKSNFASIVDYYINGPGFRNVADFDEVPLTTAEVLRLESYGTGVNRSGDPVGVNQLGAIGYRNVWYGWPANWPFTHAQSMNFSKGWNDRHIPVEDEPETVSEVLRAAFMQIDLWLVTPAGRAAKPDIVGNDERDHPDDSSNSAFGSRHPIKGMNLLLNPQYSTVWGPASWDFGGNDMIEDQVADFVAQWRRLKPLNQQAWRSVIAEQFGGA